MLALSIPLLAQVSGTNGKVLLAMAENAKKVMQYEWKQSITVTRKGKPATPVIDQVSFDSSGKMQRSTLSAAPKQMSGLRGKIEANVKTTVKEMMELAASYNKPQQIAAFVKQAQSTRNSGGSATQLAARNVVKNGDSMTMLLDPVTHLATQVNINTDCDGGPMTVAESYSPIPGGPNMMRTMKVSAARKDLAVDVSSYDFAQQVSRKN